MQSLSSLLQPHLCRNSGPAGLSTGDEVAAGFDFSSGASIQSNARPADTTHCFFCSSPLQTAVASASLGPSARRRRGGACAPRSACPPPSLSVAQMATPTAASVSSTSERARSRRTFWWLPKATAVSLARSPSSLFLLLSVAF